LAGSLSEADAVWAYQPPDSEWSLIGRLGPRATVHDTTAAIIDDLVRFTQPGDHVVIMSNGGFEGIHERLLARLAAPTGTPK
jgi:UDP-N-acetylmuramate: L-alanyl-gamma-D-glutamyl-meso-diaminopimelate ligase